eukprot:CAMPEP_0198724346 /NCGR_PEP_ID=MMETSP1475-20131203/1834_1 /TAXON_ID= ORGANISM="Unidentified sp., Strain CCMP1999" /NCGR_SAMPLE_ID=MMETSP1475 /ASSEMBLY_ACC=CAM_ASM_001111 /LENGTH=216 /DNA_ID=CAMNT_0044485845 /DNA_START=134 /DNA_END=784 /DNA_ORIENTATION=-
MGREVREGSTVDREAVKDMYRQREALTEEMEAVMSYLNADGMPGLNGSLVDSEGFPRADIDLYAVRRQRQRLRCLMNDLTQLTQRIAAALQQVLPPQPGSSAGEGRVTSPGRTTQSVSVRLADNGVSGAASSAPAPALSTPESTVPEPMTTSSVATSEHMAPPRTPFASVGDVAPNSLASTAGLQSGDQIVLFGSVESRGYGWVQVCGNLLAISLN